MYDGEWWLTAGGKAGRNILAALVKSESGNKPDKCAFGSYCALS